MRKGLADRRRAMVNAIFYLLTTGCQWRLLSKNFPPKSTVHDYYVLLNSYGYLARIHRTLYETCREQAAKADSPTLGIVHSQSVKGEEKGGNGLIHQGLTGAKTKGKKRHIAIDTLGLMIGLMVTPANIQNRNYL